MARHIAARDLAEGQMVDLAMLGPFGLAPDSRFAVAAQCEYGVVDSVEQETPTCTLVHFTNFPSFGLPPDFQVAVDEPAQR
jgi:hypothetical protein